jgi:pyruvate,water dikinase
VIAGGLVSYVLFPEQFEPGSPVGGKTAALAKAQQAGLPIPKWCVVLPAAFHASLDERQAAAFVSATDAESLARVLANVAPTEALAAEVTAAARKVAAGGALAVRSSALEEDGARLSFAGQLESLLFVEPAEAVTAVAQVWRSGFSARVLAYRRESGFTSLPSPPAVLLQRVIDGEVSGVAFSADPVSGRRGLAVVTAVPGLGTGLVSGDSDSDTWHVERDGAIVGAQIATKRTAWRRATSTTEGVVAVTLNADVASTASLDEDRVREVAELARRAEKVFGVPQDIEWTFGDGQLHLLQSRPITGLAGLADPDGALAIWDNANIAESYSGITTPLTFSFARRAYENVYRQFCRLMGVSEVDIEANAALFSCMLGLVRGRVYYNLLNWYRLVSLLPGYTFNRGFMEQMMGVREGLDQPSATNAMAPATAARLGDGLRLLRTTWRLVLEFVFLDRRVERFEARLRQVLGSERPDLSSLRPDELVAYYRDLDRQLLLHWDAPIVNDFATMVSHGMLRRLLERWVGDQDASLANDLLAAESGMVSSEPAEQVRQMAVLAAESPALVTALCEAPLAEIRSKLAAHLRLQAAYDAYLARFGERCMEELKLESLTLLDDPLPLLRAIGQYARALDTGRARKPTANVADARQVAEARIAQALAGRPLRRWLLARVIGWARVRMRTRENLRFERTRVFGRARMVFLELGRRLAALDVLEAPRDVFWLELDELMAFVDGRATTTDLRGLAALRQAEFAGYAGQSSPAERFETCGAVYIGHEFRPQVEQEVPVGPEMQGTGACAGVVRGPVRVVRDPRKAVVAPGEILVAERTDPGWVIVFPAAAGLLVERGSLLSHSAIVARELGLPTVVGLAGVTSWLADGDWVELDGASGRVTRTEPLSQDAASGHD